MRSFCRMQNRAGSRSRPSPADCLRAPVRRRRWRASTWRSLISTASMCALTARCSAFDQLGNAFGCGRGVELGDHVELSVANAWAANSVVFIQSRRAVVLPRARTCHTRESHRPRCCDSPHYRCAPDVRNARLCSRVAVVHQPWRRGSTELSRNSWSVSVMPSSPSVVIVPIRRVPEMRSSRIGWCAAMIRSESSVGSSI